MAMLAMILAFVMMSLIHAYHPPGVALRHDFGPAEARLLVSACCGASLHRGCRGIGRRTQQMETRLARLSQAAPGLSACSSQVPSWNTYLTTAPPDSSGGILDS
jgi:hypothetical protein